MATSMAASMAATPRVALCLTGEPRNVANITFPRFKTNLLPSLSCGSQRPPTIFIVSSRRLASESALAVLGPAKVIFEKGEQAEHLQHLVDQGGLERMWWKQFARRSQREYRKEHNAALWRTLLQWRTLGRCWSEVQAHERREGSAFDVVVRTRLDSLWYGPHPTLAELGLSQHTRQIPMLYTPQHYDYGGLNDRFAVASRAGFEAYASLGNAAVNGALNRTLSACSGGGLKMLTAETTLKAWLLARGVRLGTVRLPMCVLGRSRSKGMRCRFTGADGRGYGFEGSTAIVAPEYWLNISLFEKRLTTLSQMYLSPGTLTSDGACHGRANWDVKGWKLVADPIVTRPVFAPFVCPSDQAKIFDLLNRTYATVIQLNHHKRFPALSLQVGGNAPDNGDARLRHLDTALVALSAFDVPRFLQAAHIVLPIAAHTSDNDTITWHANARSKCSSSLQIVPSLARRKWPHNGSATPGACADKQDPHDESLLGKARWRSSWCRRCGEKLLSSQQVPAISLARVLEALTYGGRVEIKELILDNNGDELALLESLAPSTLTRSVRRILLACFDGKPLFQGGTLCGEASASLRRLGFAVNDSQVMNCHCGRRLLNASNLVRPLHASVI